MGLQSKLNQEQKKTDEIKSSVDEVYIQKLSSEVLQLEILRVNSVNSGASLWAKYSNQLDYDICGYRDTWVLRGDEEM